MEEADILGDRVAIMVSCAPTHSNFGLWVWWVGSPWWKYWAAAKADDAGAGVWRCVGVLNQAEAFSLCHWPAPTTQRHLDGTWISASRAACHTRPAGCRHWAGCAA